MIRNVSYPNCDRNYCLFDSNRVNQKMNVEAIETTLASPKNTEDVIESLYALNLMIDNGFQNADKLYPILSKYNNTKDPNIQTFLAGIYRKTKVPDAFGPLCTMLIQNAINPPENCSFDPNEEIGGAILDYIA